MIPTKLLSVLVCAFLVAQVLPCLAFQDSVATAAQRRTLPQRRFLDDGDDPYADLYDYKDFPTDDAPDDGSALVIKGITDENPDGNTDTDVSDSRANGLLPLGTHGGRVPYPTKDPSPPTTSDNDTDASRGVEGIQGGGGVWWRNNSGNGTAAPPSSAGENQQKQEQGTSGSSSPPSGSSSSSSSGSSGFSINGLPEGASIAIVVACCLGGILLILGSLLVWRMCLIGRVVPSGAQHKGKAVMIEDEEEGPGSPSSIRTA
ncbi:unnamed protein product [Closterium sp. Naga37s-1]|nr:unnamed protein product [Closterium sp. Naga37s-1]